MSSDSCRNGHEYTLENTRMNKGRGGKLYRLCRACQQARDRAWRAANLERAKARSRAYSAAWRAANRERANAYQRDRFAANPDYFRDYRRLRAQKAAAYDRLKDPEQFVVIPREEFERYVQAAG